MTLMASAAPSVTALEFARLRACGSATLSDALERTLATAGARVGRELRPLRRGDSGNAALAERRFVLAWNGECMPTRSEDVEVPELPPTALQSFAIVLGACWTDPASDPFPGSAVPIDEIMRRADAAGMHDTKVKAALRHDLVDARLVEPAGVGQVRLGDAVAAWPTIEVDALRREHYRIAGREER